MTWNPWRRLKLVIWASRRMRRKYRDRMEALELRWRQRFPVELKRRREAIEKDREQAQQLILRLIEVQTFFERHSSERTLGCVVRVPQEVMMNILHPSDLDEYWRYVAAELGHALERELRTINWKRIEEVEVVDRYRQEPVRPSYYQEHWK